MHIGYSQVYYHLIISPELNSPLEGQSTRNKIINKLSDILKEHRNIPYSIGGVGDHLHLLISPNLRVSLDNLINRIKEDSEAYIRNENLIKNFRWQQGYFAVTISRSQMGKMTNYVLDQESYHKEISFREEYIRLLNAHEIEYTPEDLFDFKA